MQPAVLLASRPSAYIWARDEPGPAAVLKNGSCQTFSMAEDNEAL